MLTNGDEGRGLHRFTHFEVGGLGLILRSLVRLHVTVPVQHAVTVGTGVEILRPFDFGDQLRRNLQATPRTHPPFNRRKRLVLSGGLQFGVAGQ